jgi:hypothetical protein
MWQPRRLATLWASMACYRDSFPFFHLLPTSDDAPLRVETCSTFKTKLHCKWTVFIQYNLTMTYYNGTQTSVKILIPSQAKCMLQHVNTTCKPPQRLFQPIHGPGLLFSSVIIFHIGRTPWTSDHLVARPLPKHRATQTE